MKDRPWPHEGCIDKCDGIERIFFTLGSDGMIISHTATSYHILDSSHHYGMPALEIYGPFLK